MMTVFRFNFVTFLTACTFNQIQKGLKSALKLIKSEKNNIEELYSMLYLLRVTNSNFQALDFCSINLTSLLVKDQEYKDFMEAFRSCIVFLSEEGEKAHQERVEKAGDSEA